MPRLSFSFGNRCGESIWLLAGLFLLGVHIRTSLRTPLKIKVRAALQFLCAGNRLFSPGIVRFLRFNLREPVIDVEKTIRKLKREGVEVSRLSLPSGILGRRRKLARICQERGIAPVWYD